MPQLRAEGVRGREWKLKKILVAVVILGITGTLVVLLFDISISLDHSRQQNTFLTQQCRLLVRIADAGWRGQDLATLTAKLGPNVTMKNEGSEVWIDDSVVLVLDGTKIVSVTDGTCD